MNKKHVPLVLFGLIIALSYCSAPKKAVVTTPIDSANKITYESSIKPLVIATCSPCHIPSKGGNKEALDNYSAVKTEINDIIRRIEMHPGERGFMPVKHERLSDSAIALVKQWKADGLLEK